MEGPMSSFGNVGACVVYIDKPDHHVPELTHPLMESVEAAFHVPVECVRNSKSAVGRAPGHRQPC